MNLNRDDFFSHLNSKDYDYCVALLRSEIINNLTSRIQEKDSNFKYSNLGILKTFTFKYLGKDEQQIACRLYDYSTNEIPLSTELSEMLEMYKTLIDSTISVK